MKAYLVVTGAIFGLVGIAHLLRLFVEGVLCRIRGFLGATWLCSSLAEDSRFGRCGYFGVFVSHPPNHRLERAVKPGRRPGQIVRPLNLIASGHVRLSCFCWRQSLHERRRTP